MFRYETKYQFMHFNMKLFHYGKGRFYFWQRYEHITPSTSARGLFGQFLAAPPLPLYCPVPLEQLSG